MILLRAIEPSRTARVAALAVALAVVLAGCAATGNRNHPVQTSAPIASTVSPGDVAGTAPIVPTAKNAVIPSFTGQWAGAFESAYRAATSDLQREVLKDGVISDKELSELGDQLSTCLKASGYTNVNVFPGDTGLSFKAPKGKTTSQQNAEVPQCENLAYGQVDILYGEVHRNPSHQDEFTIMAACLVRQKLVPPSFTAADYGKDASDNSFPFSIPKNSTKFNACVSDPLDAGK